MAQDSSGIIGKINQNPIVIDGRRDTVSGDSSVNITIAGKYAILEAKKVQPGWTHSNWHLIPQGYEVATASLVRHGPVAEYELALRTCDSGSVSDTIDKPASVTWRIVFQEVQHPLVNHPAIASARADCVKWLATDPSVRVDSDSSDDNSNSGNSGESSDVAYYYGKSEDDRTRITAPDAIRFCKAYSDGIETYNQYLPVIEKISTYAKLPGGTSLGTRSITGGKISISNCGTFDTPDLTLEDFTDGKWFKSGETWEQSDKSYWTRTEQWTYTNDLSHEWIYEDTNKLVESSDNSRKGQ